MDVRTIFLSYAWSDGKCLAQRLSADLEKRGYQIWRDRDRILAGDEFMDRIRTGIHNSRLMIALMTPGSVRLASDPANRTKTDSVCLNEIQEARFYARIPIIPVRAMECQPPFAINTLDYVDLTRFQEDGQVSVEGINRIVKSIDSVLAGEPVPTRSRAAILDLLDETFERFLGELREAFCGREWVFYGISAWLKEDFPKVLRITGAPGSGKSAVAAELVRRNSNSQVLAYHACKADRPPTVDPATFVRSISDMVATRIEEYGRTLDDPHMRDLLGNADKDPTAAFEFAVLKPLRAIARDGTCYVLVDALDEALAFSGETTILQLLASSIGLLPPWLRVVVTCRPGEADRRMDQPWSTKIEIKGERSRYDTLEYLDFRLKDPTLNRKLAEAGKTSETIRSWVQKLDASNDESNILFVKLLLNEVQARPADQLSENELPRELDSLYESWLSRFFQGLGSEQHEEVRRVLGIITAAAESLTRQQVARAARMNSGELLATLLRNLAAYLPENNGRIRVFHKTFTEWLVKESNPYGADIEGGRRSLADMCREEYEEIADVPAGVPFPSGDGSGVRNYALRHGVTHLLGVEDYGKAIDLLALLFQHEDELERDVALCMGEWAKEISYKMGNCGPRQAKIVDALKLASILRRFYEIEPQYGGIRMLLDYHAENWEQILEYLLSDDDYVIRFTIAQALADKVKSRTSAKLSYILQLVKQMDMNRRELGGYALGLVYAKQPRMIDPAVLNALAASEVYTGRSIVGDLLLHLAFAGDDHSQLVTESQFWNAIWDFNKLDVCDLRAIGYLVGDSRPPDGPNDEIRNAYQALQEAEDLRQTLLADNRITDGIRLLFQQYRVLGIHQEQIRGAQEEMANSPGLHAIMRLLFAHPLWDVAENAASVLSGMPREVAAAHIRELLADANWKVRYGAIEAAFGIRYVDDYELFKKAVQEFHNDANCRVRGLCVENFTAQVLACEPDERRRWCGDFATEIKTWLRDEDCWVLEHVYRLFRQLDRQGDDDFQPLLADGVSRLFEGTPEWYRLERGEFLRWIETAKRRLIAPSIAD